MIPLYIKKEIKKDDLAISKINKSSFKQPRFNPATYYRQLSVSPYYYGLVILRHYISKITDFYFSSIIGAKKVDLFMITNSISSPASPGSDSKPIKIKFGRLNTYLTDSSQFGFEALLSPRLKALYCYLPSMRGENPDNRHLNQFFHCEMEIRGTLADLIPIVENYIRILAETILEMPNLIERMSNAPRKTNLVLKKIINTRCFPQISFDEAIELLKKMSKSEKKFLKVNKYGVQLTGEGEIELLKKLKTKIPVWVCYFYRDVVPFYQKPLPENKEKTLTADLLFPPLINGAFGGEIVGSGQRQDNPKEIYESLRRQKIKSKNYKWYIDLRKSKNYVTTSGFGMGIERFLAWVLGKKKY